jgi:hypothetical protein
VSALITWILPDSLIGTLKFRETIAQNTTLYMTARRNRDKEHIACSVVDSVHANGGRFLAKHISQPRDEGKALWVKADHAVVMKKVKQAFRDNDVAEMRKTTKPVSEEPTSTRTASVYSVIDNSNKGHPKGNLNPQSVSQVFSHGTSTASYLVDLQQQSDRLMQRQNDNRSHLLSSSSSRRGPMEWNRDNLSVSSSASSLPISLRLRIMAESNRMSAQNQQELVASLAVASFNSMARPSPPLPMSNNTLTMARYRQLLQLEQQHQQNNAVLASVMAPNAAHRMHQQMFPTSISAGLIHHPTNQATVAALNLIVSAASTSLKRGAQDDPSGFLSQFAKRFKK